MKISHAERQTAVEMDQHESSKEDEFRKSFKKFKSSKEIIKRRNPTVEPTNQDVINILLDPTLGGAGADGTIDVTSEDILLSRSHQDLTTTTFLDNPSDLQYKRLGLCNPNTWKIYDLKYPEGLIFIRNPFTPEGQRYWIKRSVIDFPNSNFITNIDNLENKEGISIKSKLTEEEFYKKLRWITFGYHHNWDTKVYSEENKCKFPDDLADLTSFMAKALGFTGFKAEAAIANYYHLDSTLSGHVDRSEANQTAPLFSLSFGQPAVFLIGGREKSLKPQAILLRSGDVAIMAGNSRLAYHGVPKVFYSSDEPWSDASIGSEEMNGILAKKRKLELEDASAEDSSNNEDTLDSPNNLFVDWTSFLKDYVSKSRINLNVRQVLFPGHCELAQSFANASNKPD